MKSVPLDHLAWLRAQPWIRDYPAMFAYIESRKADIDTAQPKEAPPLAQGGFRDYEEYTRYGRG